MPILTNRLFPGLNTVARLEFGGKKLGVADGVGFPDGMIEHPPSSLYRLTGGDGNLVCELLIEQLHEMFPDRRGTLRHFPELHLRLDGTSSHHAVDERDLVKMPLVRRECLRRGFLPELGGLLPGLAL